MEETRGRQEDGNKEQNQEDSLGTKDGERYLEEWIVLTYIVTMTIADSRQLPTMCCLQAKKMMEMTMTQIKMDQDMLSRSND